MKSRLIVKNLKVSIENKNILHGIFLQAESGEIHTIMGPNGSGKSTLTMALSGHPKYQVSKSAIIKINTKKINGLSPDDRAKAGLFVSFQQPISIPGVNIFNFLRLAYSQQKKTQLTAVDFLKLLKNKAKSLKIPEGFLHRSLNEELSGGEKKKTEILQALILQPKFAIFDEIDTGLDVDALKVVAKAISKLQKNGVGIIIITHYRRILKYLKPDKIHILVNGKIVKTGPATLANVIEKTGYEQFQK